MTNRERELLIRLMEECSEVVKECSKALIYGLDDINPNELLNGTNKERIEAELTDVLAIAEMLDEGGTININSVLSRSNIYGKKVKVEKWMVYAEKNNKTDKKIPNLHAKQ